MKASSFWILGIALGLATPATAQTITQGTWTGTLKLSTGATIPIEFAVQGEGESLDIVMKAVAGPPGPVTEIEFSGDDISFMWGAFSCSLERKGNSKYEGECGGAADGQLSLEAPTEQSSNTNILTGEQLEETEAGTVFDAIRQLRPRWLSARGGGVRSQGNLSVSVFMGSQRMGSVDFLRQLDPNAIRNVRYYSASEAITTYGNAAQGGVILITRR